VRANVKPGATLLTNSYLSLEGYGHELHRCEEPPRLPTTFDLLRRYRRRRGKAVDVYLNRFVIHHNDCYRQVSFDTVLGIAARQEPKSYWDIVGRDNPRKGLPTTRRSPRVGRQQPACERMAQAPHKPHPKKASWLAAHLAPVRGR
jgi:hypothetical protein